MSRIDDERLEKLGEYFIFHGIGERHKLTFRQFILMVDRGDWEVFVA